MGREPSSLALQARLPNWDVELAVRARALVGLPFAWGRTDCGTICRQALDALYGPEAAQAVLGDPWTDLRGAAKVWCRIGDAKATLLGCAAERVHRSYASAGDVIVLPGKDEEGLPRLGIVIGGRYLRVSRVDGVLSEPIGTIDPAAEIWRLPGGTSTSGRSAP